MNKARPTRNNKKREWMINECVAETTLGAYFLGEQQIEGKSEMDNDSERSEVWIG